MSSKKHIVVVGAGPGGLSAAMLLAAKGYRVSVYEKDDRPGGRNAPIRLNGFTFDTGPTFLMMKGILDGLFAAAGKRTEDLLECVRLEPMYRLLFADKTLMVSGDTDRMKAEIEKYFPGESGGLDIFKQKEKTRFNKLFPCLEQDYSSWPKLFSANLWKALPHLSLGNTVYEELGKYFKSEDLKLAFTFQAKYLGMSAWRCPALFTMLPFIEHDQGVFHVKGGLNQISRAMADVVEEYGGKIHFNTPVKQLVKTRNQITAAILEDGSQIQADAFIINADFAHSMSTLFQPGVLKKYTPKKLQDMTYSCSTFMLYLGLDKTYPQLPHHNIIFAKDYHQNVQEIFETKTLSRDISFYVQNACVTDPSLAPQGQSTLYVLVPVPNNTSGIDWPAEKQRFRQQVLQTIEARTELKDLRRHIVAEKIICPSDWTQNHNVYQGATFNLAHQISQMLYWRPHNRFEEANNCYIVGGGTHPGSGLPTIYESAKISAALIQEDLCRP